MAIVELLSQIGYFIPCVLELALKVVILESCIEVVVRKSLYGLLFLKAIENVHGSILS